MGLIELCLLSLLSPQAPETTPASPVEATETAAPPGEPAAPPTTAATATADDDPRKRLLAAEQAGDQVDGNELLDLASCPDPAVAARAVWLLTRSKNPAHRALITTVLESSPHADARLQAMHGLLRVQDPAAVETALAMLSDEDRRVRTIAVQLLGKRRQPTMVEPLLALIDTVAASNEAGPATDVQAALLTLTDLDATPQLLRMATAIHDGNVEATGNALAYAFQTLTPAMSPRNETTLLVAVLGHREALLRRYAITRLAELGSPTAAGALEGRLAAEGPELRPLVEVALSQIRSDRTEQPRGEVERAKNNAKALWAQIKARWHALEPLQQGLVGGTPALLLVIIWLLRRRRRNRQYDEDALAVSAMIAPSDEYLEGQEEDGYDDEYEDDYEGEDVEGDETYDDDGFEQEQLDDDEHNEYDTSGWDEDDEAVHSDAGGYDDERPQ